METKTTLVTDLLPNDHFYMGEPSARIQPRVVVIPSPDVIRPMKNGKPVRDTSGKVVTIVRERTWLESCPTDFGAVHVHTERGIFCCHYETTVERKVD